jgi:hypothetical protein
MVRLSRRAARIPFAPVVGLMFGGAAAILVAAMPVRLFERAIVTTGLPAWLSIAAPPLGFTARVLGIVAAFMIVALCAWLVATPLSRWLERDRRRRTPWRDDGYAGADGILPAVDVRRRPIFAPDELGAPLMSDQAIAGDDMSLPASPPPLLPDDALLPAADEPPVIAQTSIRALIGRLESGLAKRGLNPDRPPPGAALLALSSDWIVDSDAEAPDAAESEPESDPRAALQTLRRLVAAR